METKKNNLNSRIKALLLVLSMASAFLLIACIFFHVTPFALFDSMASLASHHIFLTTILCFVVIASCLKLYFSINEQIIKRYEKKVQNQGNQKTRKKTQRWGLKKNLTSEIKVLQSSLIEKELVGSLSFDNKEVLRSQEAIEKRNEDLIKSMKLGNMFKHKVILFFKDSTSYKHTITTIWQANTNHVTLKGGIVLPVRAIYEVKI